MENDREHHVSSLSQLFMAGTPGLTVYGCCWTTVLHQVSWYTSMAGTLGLEVWGWINALCMMADGWNTGLIVVDSWLEHENWVS